MENDQLEATYLKAVKGEKSKEQRVHVSEGDQEPTSEASIVKIFIDNPRFMSISVLNIFFLYPLHDIPA